jgi:hypothetical protein
MIGEKPAELKAPMKKPGNDSEYFLGYRHRLIAIGYLTQ